MRILHLSTDDVTGGAPRAAYRLHVGLRRLGCDSSMFVAQRKSNDPSVLDFTPPRDFLSRRLRRIRGKKIKRSIRRYCRSSDDVYELFTDDRSEHGSNVTEQLPLCDVLNLHWIAGFIDYRTFFAAVPRHTPMVWTLHDMNPFTGGCHYDNGCGKWRGSCGACPQLGSSDPADLSRQIWERKREAFAKIDPGQLHIVTPSLWLAAEAEQSYLLRQLPVRVIPYGVDVEEFAPRNRSFARDVIGVPQHARVILCVANFLANRRKGFNLLAKALVRVTDIDSLFLISVGNGKPAVDAKIAHLHLGTIENNRLLSLVYSAADIFVIPSLQDNMPNTVLESLACGTPVVGFAVGGIPELVRPGITGLLVPFDNVDELRTAIGNLLKDTAMRAEMSANCRRIAEEQYALEVQTRRYIELYQQLVS